MGSVTIHCWKFNAIFSFRCCILQRHFLYSTSATTTIGPISTSEEPYSLSTITNWLMNSLDFSEKDAISTSSKLAKRRKFNGAKKVCDPNLLRKADSVINFLHQKGFQKPQIRNVVYFAPQILASRIEKTLEPKMKFFQDLGLSVSDFSRVIPTQPLLLSDGLDSTIRPVIEDLRAIMGSDEDVVRVIKGLRFNMLRLVPKHLVCNVSTLQSLGIPIESIRKHILQLPSPFMRRPEAFKEILTQAETKWGVAMNSPNLLDAIHVLTCLNEETIESKCRVFESFGWDRSDMEGLFRRRPLCFALSEANLKEKLRFFVDKLGYDPGYIVAHSAMLSYSLEKRLVPRYIVFELLKDTGLIRGAFYSLMQISESVFLARFVRPFEGEIPDLLLIYTKSISSSFTTRQYKRRKDLQWFQESKIQSEKTGMIAG